MRTVNRNVISLIHAKKSGKASKNTEVVSSDFESHVYLFGKHIATYDYDTRALYCRDAGWQTVTTSDRLNALLAEFAPAYRIVQRKHKWYIDNLACEISENVKHSDILITWPGDHTFT